MMKQGSISLNKKQLQFVIKVTGISDPIEAVERFAIIMMEEKVDPSELQVYVVKMMERTEPKSGK